MNRNRKLLDYRLIYAGKLTALEVRVLYAGKRRCHSSEKEKGADAQIFSK